METKHIHSPFSSLLPYSFHVTGWAITALCLLFGAVVNYSDFTWLPKHLSVYAGYGLFAGLFLSISSRLREEDELTSLIRLKAYEWAFRWGIINTILACMGIPGLENSKNLGVLLQMLIVFHLVFFVKNRSR